MTVPTRRSKSRSALPVRLPLADVTVLHYGDTALLGFDGDTPTAFADMLAFELRQYGIHSIAVVGNEHMKLLGVIEPSILRADD